MTPCRFGDLSACKRVDFHPRHEVVEGQLTGFCQSSGLNPTTDVAIKGRPRPADNFLPHFSGPKSEVGREGPAQQGVQAVPGRHKLNFIPFLMSTYRACEEEDRQPFLEKLGGVYTLRSPKCKRA